MGYGLLGASTCITWFYMTCQPLLIQKKNNLYPQKQAAYLPFICTRASQRCAGSHDSGFHTLHTVVSLPYYPIHLKEKIISKLILKSKVVYLRCQRCVNIPNLTKIKFSLKKGESIRPTATPLSRSRSTGAPRSLKVHRLRNRTDRLNQLCWI